MSLRHNEHPRHGRIPRGWQVDSDAWLWRQLRPGEATQKAAFFAARGTSHHGFFDLDKSRIYISEVSSAIAFDSL